MNLEKDLETYKQGYLRGSFGMLGAWWKEDVQFVMGLTHGLSDFLNGKICVERALLQEKLRLEEYYTYLC